MRNALTLNELWTDEKYFEKTIAKSEGQAVLAKPLKCKKGTFYFFGKSRMSPFPFPEWDGEEFLMNPPAWTGLDGKIQGKWIEETDELSIIRIHGKLKAPE